MEYEKGVMELIEDNTLLSQIPRVDTSEFVSEYGVEKCSKELSTSLLALLCAVYMIKAQVFRPSHSREYCTVYQNAWYTHLQLDTLHNCLTPNCTSMCMILGSSSGFCTQPDSRPIP